MEERKNKFFDLDVQAKIDNPDSIKVDEPFKKGDTFSKVFGDLNTPKEEPVQQSTSTFENVFKTQLQPEIKTSEHDNTSIEQSVSNVQLIKEEVPAVKPSSQTFSEVFQTEVKVEPQKAVKQDGIPTNSSKFFNVEPKIEEPVVTIKTEEASTDFVEKVGDNPMVDYERINREAKENAPLEESEDVIPKKEEIVQSNRNLTARVNMGGSDLMKLRMQRR